MKNLIFIPTYNEEDSINLVLKYLYEVSPQDDVLIVDDASTDRTLEEIANYVERNPWHTITVIRKQRRYHLRDSFKIAFDYFNKFYTDNIYQFLICYDAGMSFDLHPILAEVTDKIDILIGVRKFSSLWKQNRKRAFISWFGTALFNLAHLTWFTDTTSGLRAYHREVAYRTEWRYNRARRFGVQQDLLSQHRHVEIVEIPVEYTYTSSSFNPKVFWDALFHCAIKFFYKPTSWKVEK